MTRSRVVSIVVVGVGWVASVAVPPAFGAGAGSVAPTPTVHHVRVCSQADPSPDIARGCQGNTAIGVARPNTPSGKFKWLLSNTNSNTDFVTPYPFYGEPPLGDIPVVGDWNGDGKSTIGVVRFDPTTYQWQWILTNDNINPIEPYPLYGSPFFGDIPVVGDWDGDGVDTIGFARANTPSRRFEWHLSNDDGTNTVAPLPLFGQAHVDPGDPDDVPIVGDWNGDSTDTIGVARPDQASQKFKWILKNDNLSSALMPYPRFGQPYGGDIPVVGDWNGDLTSTIGVVRTGANGRFKWIRSNVNRGTITTLGPPYPVLGQPAMNDKPVVGDWNGA